MFEYTVLFIDDTTGHVQASDLDEAFSIAFDTFDNQIVDIWCD